MTVAELIKQLQEMPQDSTVGYFDGSVWFGGWSEIDAVEYVELSHTRHARPPRTVTLRET